MILQYWRIRVVSPFPINVYPCTAGRTLSGLFIASRSIKLGQKLYWVSFFIDALVVYTERYKGPLSKMGGKLMLVIKV